MEAAQGSKTGKKERMPREAGKAVMVVTQMLVDSMHERTVSRAEELWIYIMRCWTAPRP